MEKPWEQRLQEQREKDEQERLEKQKMQSLSDMRAPHLTNLHEDLQLSGKIYYSLLSCLEETEEGRG